MLPLWFDLSSRKAVVFGGGAVGRRKANFLASEAEVVVISREFTDGFAPSVRLRSGNAEGNMKDMIGWADLVIAATDDIAVNDAIAAEAAAQGKYCNRADGVSTFLIPSVVERENYKVAVSTEGRSPGMSKYLRLELDRLLDRRYGLMVALQEELRQVAREVVPSQAEREERLWKVLKDERVWKALENDPGRARELALQIVVS
ncbi:MAG: bifunctional precorrin-2 dehydrogenase/sirohydrochlorin ferrochelatase [Methanomassiliicoccus sp.]|nr:bifunctional precorrin-2 dehydrogenase/sirohydrochlorin ferrochelatase [Methanomassiliicoccus sp.]